MAATKLWTVYRAGFLTGGYVAKLRVASPRGMLVTNTIFHSPNLEVIRQAMRKAGLTLVEVRVDLDPDIIEVWK